MSMKRKMMAVIMAVGAVLCVFADVAVTDVVAKQRYPWNGLVDISCKVTGIEGETSGLKFALTTVISDSDNARPIFNFWIVREGTNSTDRKVYNNGDYRILWDARADLGQVCCTNISLRVTIKGIRDSVQLWEGGPYWSEMNVGADEPWEYGYYFWWGDVVGYKREGDVWVASDESLSGFSFSSGNTPTYEKSPSTLQNGGWITTDNVLTPEHDAAYVQWGGGWRMPTYQELYDLWFDKCDWAKATMNGINGCIVRGRGGYASNSIFLPAAGRGSGTSFYDANSRGDYWSSVIPSGPYHAYEMGFNLSNLSMGGYSRYFGLPVRPVLGVAEAAMSPKIVAHTGVSMPFLVDTMGKIRIVNENQDVVIAYSPRWNGASTCTVAEIGKAMLVVDATEDGEVSWTPQGMGYHTLTHTAGDEMLTAAFVVPDFDETEVVLGEEISESTYWPKEKTLVVNGILTVKAGATLTIAPGAIVKFMDGAGIVCEAGGRCVADGVIFTHVNDDTVGGDTLLDGSTSPLADMYVLNGVSGNDATQYRYHPDPTVTLSGTISKNEVWRGFNVYCVTGSVTVASGVTLTVEPGAIIKFAESKSLTVNSGATLNAIGTRAEPIIFTSIKDDDYGGDTNGDGKSAGDLGDWDKIGINGGTANFECVHILYSSRNATTGAINMNGGTVMFSNGEIAHGLYDAVGVESGNFYMTNSVIRDCLLAFRHWARDSIVNCVIYDCGRLTQGGGQHFVNCAFSHITETWEAFGFPQNGTTYRNCCFWNEGGSVLTGEGTQDAMTVCGKDGNIWGNPRFLDPDNGDFRVDDKSPCMDAGLASVAPETDYFGQPRVNVPDVGICEVIPRGTTSDVDLVPQSVTADAEAVSGQLLTINWTVSNQGGADIDGEWRDTLSLVSENGRSIVLGEKVIARRLVAGGTISCSASFIVPAVAEGTWHPKVNVNSSRDIFEGALGGNNALTGETAIRVVSAALDGGSEAATELTLDAGKDTTFRLANDAETGSLLVIRTGGDLSAWLGVGNSVLQANAIRTATKVSDGVWLLQIPAGDDVYVSLENMTSSAQEVSLTREVGDFYLFDLGRMTAANSGSVTLCFAGNGFADGISCRLESDGRTIEATEVNIESGVSGNAMFVVTGETPGDWNLVVKRGEDEISLPCLTLTESRTGPKWTSRLDVASLVRSQRVYTGTFEYGNNGDMPLAAPYVKLTASAGTQIRLTEADPWTDTIEIMAISESYPASQLKPGENRQVPFLYKTAGGNFKISYEYSPVETMPVMAAIAKLTPVTTEKRDPTAGEVELAGYGIYKQEEVQRVMARFANMSELLKSFPWETNAEYMRPTWATDEMWGHALTILKANLGFTWYSYQQRMRKNCDYLMKIGQPTCRLDRLFQLEVNEALGVDRVVQTLARGTDLARSGRGMGLSFARTYSAAMNRRLTSGRLGYGWLDNYSIWAELHPIVVWSYQKPEDNEMPAAGGESVAGAQSRKTTRLAAKEVIVASQRVSFSEAFSQGWKMRGWTGTPQVIDGATVEFHLPGGSSYIFERQNGVWQPQSANDKTKLEIKDGEYVLTFLNGTVYRLGYETGLPISITDNQANVISFTHNGTNLVKVEHSDGQSLSFTYSGNKIASATDDQGRTVSYGYMGDMLTSVTAFNGLVTRYVYHEADATPLSRALTQIVYPDGTTKDYTYDEQGRVATISMNGNQFTTEIVRGVCGSYSVIAPNGGVTEVTVGASGETLKTVNALGQRVEQKYTADTLLESVIAPSGKRNKISYDGEGKTVAALSASGAETKFAYEPDFDNLASVTDAKGHAISYGYDSKGRGNSISYVDGSASSLEYNERGDVVKATNRRGESIAYEYDAEGNLVKKTWPNGRTFTMAYDAKGNVTNAADSVTGTVTMEYDENERLTRIVYPKDRGFTYTYDDVGRMIERTAMGGTDSVPSAADIQRFAYDSLGRLATVTDGDGTPYLTNAYDPTTGWLVTQTYGNGTIVSNAYDILGRTIGIYHLVGRAVPGEPPLAFFEYAYDADGKCISQTTAEGTESYTYDADGQLTSVTYPDKTSESFTYDAVGNRITHTGTTGVSPVDETYTVNSLNQYTAISGGPTSVSAIEYDLDGNMTRNGDTYYTYDTLNRLVAVTNESKNIHWSCEYDVFGNRVSVTHNGTTTEKVFVLGSLPSVAAEYQGDTLIKRHILVGAVRVADLTGTTGVSPVASSARYYHADMLGSARLLTDGTGATKGTRSFKAFGETCVFTGETTDAGYVGTLGVETDSNGLLFMRNRYYDAGMGRFMQMDPIGLNAGDVNVYRYCGNNSPIKTDVNGQHADLAEHCKKVISNPGNYNEMQRDNCQNLFPGMKPDDETVIRLSNSTRNTPNEINQAINAAWSTAGASAAASVVSASELAKTTYDVVTTISQNSDK